MRDTLKSNLKITGALLLAIFLYRAGKQESKPDTITLPDDASAAVVVSPSHTTLIDNVTHTPIAIPNYGHGTTIVVKPNGTVTVKPKTKGWTFDAGLAYSNRNRLSIVCELGYYRRLNWLAGVTVYPITPNAWTGVGYRLPWARVNNLSVYAGCDTDVKFVTGIFWRFGNS